MGVAYVKAVQAQGVAASIKHFPGDGVDERDQHLVTSINDLPCEAWEASYGAVYRACIEAGALTVMVGHIAQPNWSRRLDPTLADRDILPASLAPELLGGLLRDRLGFNGLIVTDAYDHGGHDHPDAPLPGGAPGRRRRLRHVPLHPQHRRGHLLHEGWHRRRNDHPRAP
jgi:beta-N-acetylhexosaminidase